MWIYLISLTISSVLTSAILSVLIPKFKKREERENTFASVNRMVFPDKRTKGYFIFLTIFCLTIGLILLFVPQLCEIMGFNWLATNIVWSIILVIDLIFTFVFFQVSHVEYNDNFILITNIFHRTKRVFYYEIIMTKANFKIFTKKKKYFIPCGSFYGGKDFKHFVLEKLNTIR